jgi:two-component system sensor histidine kinase YesM
MKLRHKMFLIYSLVAVIPVIVIGYYSYWRWQQYTAEQITTYSSTLVANATEQANRTLDSIDRTLDFLTYYSDQEDTSVVEILSEFSGGPDTYTAYDIFRAGKRTDAIFSNLMYTNDMLKGIYLIAPDGMILGTSDGADSRINVNHDCRQDLWYKQTTELNGAHYLSTFTSDNLFIDQSPSLYLARCVYDVYSHKFLGTMLLDLDPDLLNLDSLATIPDLTLLSISNTKTGEVLYSNADKLNTNKVQYTDNRHKSKLNLEPLELSITFHYKTLYSQYNPTGVIILTLIIMFIVGELLTLYLVTKSLTFPLERLSRVMSHQHKNGLKFISPYLNRTDEIGMLYQEYSNMLNEISQSIKKNYRDRLIVLDSQMKALEARINSHFLFNTLESINSMAELSDNENIATMSLALGNMFRYSIKTNSELVTLGEELNHVDDYVSIQTIRFSGRFRLVKTISPDLMDQKVLKLILQPLVENALYHGLNYCTTGNEIKVIANKSAGLLHISVVDNGVGMDEATLKQLHELLAEESAFTDMGKRNGRSIGLKNIHTRIQLYYGKDYGLNITSKKGEGTNITITIPLMKERIFHDD